jgi:hypothetical protein
MLAVTALPTLFLATAARRWWPAAPDVAASAGEHQAA